MNLNVNIQYSVRQYVVFMDQFLFFFFLSTGFHGIRVLVGTLILIISLIRIYYFHFPLIHHINYEFDVDIL